MTQNEGKDMWWNELPHEDDKNSSNTNDDGLLKVHTIDPERLKFNGSAFEWDNLLNVNDGLMMY